MKSRPRSVDAAPSAVFAWKSFVGTDGRERPLPEHALVTSRGDAALGAKDRHYALVCRFDAPLALGDHGPFDPAAYRNLGGTGAPVGASQVTVLLRRVSQEGPGDYRVNLRAMLTGDLWVRLLEPVVLGKDGLAALNDPCAYANPGQWGDLVARLRAGPARSGRRHAYKPALL